MKETKKGLKIMEWNLNLRSKGGQAIPKFVFDKIISEQYDVVILTEYKIDVFFESLLKYNNYQVFTNVPTYDCNEVLIAIRNDIEVLKIIPKIPNVDKEKSPNFLHVEIEFNDEIYNVIGTRIRTLNDEKLKKKNKKLFKTTDNQLRETQMSTLLRYVNPNWINVMSLENKPSDEKTIEDKSSDDNTLEDNSLKNVIIAGDFNPICSRGKYNTDIQNKNIKDIDDSDKWCYWWIKGNLGEELQIFTPENEKSFSWVDKDYDKNSKIYLIKNYYLNDHIIVSKELNADNVFYDWDIKSKNGSATSVLNIYKNKKIPEGIPDHAIISAVITQGTKQEPEKSK